MKKTFIGLMTVFTVFLMAGAVLVPQAEAACSANGYYHSNGKCAKSFKTYDRDYKKEDKSVASLEAYIEYLIKILERLQELQTERDNVDEFDVSTRSAVDIDEDSAVLRGLVERDSDEEVTVYFEYGRDKDDLDSDTTHINLDEDDSDSFSRRLINLREDTKYYFRAVAINEDGDRERGSILSFVTEDDSNQSGDDLPDADTDDAEKVTDDSAELHGSVDMNDFNNGLVFFAYGEDENQVKDIADEYDEYDDIDEDGDDLQVVKVDSDLDSDDDYSKDVTNLDPDREHYFSICVEYEDNDGRSDIICGDVETFTTEE